MNRPYTCPAQEYIGRASAYTIGLVIPSLDPLVKQMMGIPDKYASIGIISSRTGTVTQALAIDDACKAADTDLLKFEMAIDAGRQCGQGCLFVIGGASVEDARRAVQIALDRTDYWVHCLYVNHVGHMECHVTANAGQVLHQIFGVPLGRPMGILGAAPAGIGLTAVDRAMKEAAVDIVWYGSPSHNLLMMNEFSVAITGDLAAVTKAIDCGKAVGCELLNTCGMPLVSVKEAAGASGEESVRNTYTPEVCRKKTD